MTDRFQTQNPDTHLDYKNLEQWSKDVEYLFSVLTVQAAKSVTKFSKEEFSEADIF